MHEMEGGVETQSRACEECTRKCLQTHGQGKRLKSSCSDQVSFFKIMLGPYESTLFIPPIVRLVLESMANETVYLEDLEGFLWKVKLSVINNSLAFEEGWNQFVSAHKIEYGEFLVFKYIDRSKFIVQIFSKSGHERVHFICNNKSNPLKRKKKIDSRNGHLHLHKHKHKRPSDKLKEKCRSTHRDLVNRNKEGLNSTNDCKKHSMELVDECSQMNNLNKHEKNPSPLGDKCCMPVVDHPFPHKDGKTVVASNEKREFISVYLSNGKKAGITSSNDVKEPKNESVDDHLDLNISEKIFLPRVEQNKRMMSREPPISNAPETSDTKFHAENSRKLSLNSKVSIDDGANQQRHHNVSIKEFRRTDDDKMIAPSTYPHHVEGWRTEIPEIPYQDRDASKQSKLNSPFIDLDDIEMVDNGKEYEESKKLAAAGQESPRSKNNSIRLNNSLESACIKHELKDSLALDQGNCTTHLSDEGTCSVLGRNSVLQPDPRNIYPINVAGPDIDVRKCEINDSFLIKETSFQNLQDIEKVDRDKISKYSCDRDYNPFSDITAKHQCIVEKKLVGSSGNCSGIIPKMADASFIEKNTSQEPGSDTGGHEDPDINGRSGNVSVLEERKKKCDPFLNRSSCAVIKTDVTEAAKLSLPDPVKFSFSVAAISQNWHELPESLPSKWKRNERKVILLRDIFKKVWPVLYLQSERFTGFLGGWLAFASAQSLREGDVCILEMVNESEALFAVQISRK